MATQCDLGGPRWLGYVLACGVPAAMLGGFATTDQVLAHPGLIPNLVAPALLVCGLNAWVRGVSSNGYCWRIPRGG